MKKNVILIICIILIVVSSALFVWWFPLLRAAHILGKADDFSRFNFNIGIKINEANLSNEQLRFVNTISNLIGVDSESVLNLRAEGSLYDNSAYAVIYLDNLDIPVTDVYIYDNEAFINVKMLYELIQERLIEKYPLLSALLPDWKYGEYITSGQLETIFEVDFENLFTIMKHEGVHEPSFFKCAALLASLESQKNAAGYVQFETVWNDLKLCFVISENDNVPTVLCEGSSTVANSKIESVSGSISFDLKEEIVMPDSVVSQQTIDGFAKLWSVLTEIRNSFF